MRNVRWNHNEIENKKLKNNNFNFQLSFELNSNNLMNIIMIEIIFFYSFDKFQKSKTKSAMLFLLSSIKSNSFSKFWKRISNR